MRVTLQLHENGGVEVAQDGKTLVVSIDNKQETVEKPAETAKDLTDSESRLPRLMPPRARKRPSPAKPAHPPTRWPAARPALPPPRPSRRPRPAARATVSISSSNHKSTHRYYGKHIWLQVQDAELADVFRIVSEASEFNIVLSDLIKGKAQLNLTDIPWDEALDIILKSYHLGAERQGNVLRITTLESLTAEHDAEVAAKKSQEAAEPLVVKIFSGLFTRVPRSKTSPSSFATS